MCVNVFSVHLVVVAHNYIQVYSGVNLNHGRNLSLREKKKENWIEKLTAAGFNEKGVLE